MRNKLGTGRIPRLWRLAELLVLALSLVVAGIVYGVRATRADYGCVQMDSRVSRTLIDLGTGLRADKVVSEQRLASPGNKIVPLSISWSPDRQHVAYTTIDPPGSAPMELFVRPTRWAGIGEPIVIERDASPLYGWLPQLIWSPDSQYLAYDWITVTGQHTIVIVGSDGRKSVTTGSDSVYFFGWSADSAYFAFSIPDSPPSLSFWSRVTGQFIDPDDKNMTRLESGYYWFNVGWSLLGHRLAYLSGNTDGKNRLVILTPGGDAPAAFDLPDRLLSPELLPTLSRSPDGRYVAVVSLPEERPSLRRLSIFSIDGNRYADVSERVSVSYPRSSLPDVQWIADGQSLVYMEAPDGNLSLARLVAFHVDSGQKQILLTGVRGNGVSMQDGRYVRTAWESGNRVVAGFVDVITGTTYPLSEYGSLSGLSLWISPDSRIVAATSDSGSNAGMQLWATDGSWKRTATTLTGYHTLTWSPDGALLAAVRQLPAFQGFGLDVFRLDGTSVYHADAIAGDPPDAITWTHCEANLPITTRRN